MAPPDWTPLTWQAKADGARAAFGKARRPNTPFTSLFAREAPDVSVESPGIPEQVLDAIERAAGTGLTGSSNQEFVPVSVGALEAEATVIRLRLVIGSEEALATPRPLPTNDAVPARPAPRP